MIDLIQKTFTMKVLGREIEFEQLSYYDCLMLHYKLQNNFDLYAWAKDFLGQRGFTEKELPKALEEIELAILFNLYIENACKGLYSKDTKKGGESIPPESFFAFIAEKMNLDVITMLKTYTPEAFNYVVEGIVYNINAQTKEGQKANKLRQIKSQEVDKEDFLRRVQEMREKRKNKT